MSRKPLNNIFRNYLGVRGEVSDRNNLESNK